MADKARDAFRTISEVANWLDIPAHVLRFWESKFPQIKPVKRAGGRRYYRPADMQLIGGIKTLLHDDGLTIRGVQKMLKEDGVKAVSELSPSLDMPSEEEGAARRQARRARRQARQDARKTEGTTAPSEPPSTPEQRAEPEADAPFIHVEDGPPEVDNVVSMTGERDALTEMSDIEAYNAPDEQNAAPEPISEEPVDDVPQEELLADSTALAAEETVGNAPEPDITQDEPTPVTEDAHEPAAEPEPEQSIAAESNPEPEIQDTSAIDALRAELEAEDEPETDPVLPLETQAEPELELEPTPDIPADPDPAEITLTDGQLAFAHTLKRLRRGGGDQAAKQVALAKLTGLRTRMASRPG